MKNIEKIKENVALALKKNFPQTSQSISADNLVLIHEGRFANAAVLRYKDDSLDLTVKDFSGSPFWIRRVFGVFSTRTEYTAKKALAQATGDHGVLQRLSPWSIAFDYVRGDTLNKVPCNVPADYFIKMEQIVSKLHECGFVHLDLRNLGNMILGDDGKPYIYHRFPILSFDETHASFYQKILGKGRFFRNLQGMGTQMSPSVGRRAKVCFVVRKRNKKALGF